MEMKAIRQHMFGGPEELRLEDAPDPRPGEGEVRIRVESAGVHVLDTVIRKGEAGPWVMPSLPMIPGREVAGVVDQAGPGTDSALLGRRVVAELGLASGGYAELALAKASGLHDIPGSLDADQAVTMIGTGRTAMAILELAQPARGDVVAVTAAASGIGTLLVQATRNVGATVIGAAGGPDKTALAHQLGAAITADYLQPDWAQRARADLHGRGATLVLDGVGGDIGRTAMNMLDVSGRLIMYGSASGSLIPLTADDLYRLGITAAAAIGARILQRPGGLRDLETRAIQAAAHGRLRPVIGQRYPLADAPAAHTAIESRSTTGKTILRP
jgi:NADPH:quinone reductase